jgi:serine phosphatase RsbU (regulator of sigma subunit)
LLTDGITEAMNADEEFGEDRIIDLLRENRKLSPACLQQRLLDSVNSFATGGLSDDATLVTVSLSS